MQTPQKKKYTGKYDAKLKIAIAREYLTSDLGYRSLSEKYNIPRTSIHDIVKWYKEKYPEGVEGDAENTSERRTGNKDMIEANLKITALEMLIENAGKELGIDLVKKFGTKQPKK
jgi:transposase-like protein